MHKMFVILFPFLQLWLLLSFSRGVLQYLLLLYIVCFVSLACSYIVSDVITNSTIWPYLAMAFTLMWMHFQSTDMVGTASGFFPRFGTTRLFALKILATLFRKENDNVMRELLALNTLLTCFTMFKTYPNNNFLHNEIYSILDFSLMCAPENEKSELQPRLVFAVQGKLFVHIIYVYSCIYICWL